MKVAQAGRGIVDSVKAFWPAGPAGWVLLALLLSGVFVRGYASFAWSPTVDWLSDSGFYALYASGNPLESPQHPAGYSAFLAITGVFTRDVSVIMALQNLLGIGSALVFFALTRRVAGSPWPALVPAGVVLLGADQILLERAVMSEALFTTVLAAGLYCGVRMLETPDPWWRWPLAAGLVLALSATIRSAGAFLVPVALIALVFARPRPWRSRWRSGLALAVTAAVILVAYSSANAITRGSFELGPSQGWHLYSRAATFADCDKFTPPEGSEALCERTPPAKRLGGSWYLLSPDSPAIREFGGLGEEDALVGDWARAAVLSDIGAYLDLVWGDFRAFFVPSRTMGPIYAGHSLDPSLDWRYPLTFDEGQAVDWRAGTVGQLETFYNDIEIDSSPAALQDLHDYQRVFRFGATALTICTLLAILGLLIGPRKNRVAILLLAGSGIAILVSPALAGIYVGRYTVPIAGPVAGAAALAAMQLWRFEHERRSTGTPA